jgi:hypothetical protein
LDQNTNNVDMEAATKTRRIRAKGTMRRRLGNHPQGAVRINSDAISAILAPLYSELPKTLAAGDHNLTYGEVEWPTLKLMLEYVQKEPVTSLSGRFYDLGSGRGRAVLYMSLSGLFDYSVGIEVLPERVALAKQALLKLRVAIPSAGAKVKLYEASFLHPSFKYKAELCEFSLSLVKLALTPPKRLAPEMISFTLLLKGQWFIK